jgi:hypothetical protein
MLCNSLLHASHAVAAEMLRALIFLHLSALLDEPPPGCPCRRAEEGVLQQA